jgi:hypothetical protein
VRSYTRGIVVRSVGAETRQRLFERLSVSETANLRSFLDKPQPKGKTLKGSGKVGFVLHKHNHHKQVVRPNSTLRDQVHAFCILFIVYVHLLFYVYINRSLYTYV